MSSGKKISYKIPPGQKEDYYQRVQQQISYKCTHNKYSMHELILVPVGRNSLQQW